MTLNPTCGACGQANDAAARFCRACGAAFPTGPIEATRRVVTVVFSDLADSTALSQRLDAESLRNLMSRYFGAMQAALESHGGVVEKFIGDAVVAVFGVPRAHEDDAVRAVRAAVEMRDVLRELNEEFARSFGVTLACRTGVNTGEVSAGDPSRSQSFVAGEAVNAAARLEQAAAVGEILISGSTYRLVQEAVVAEDAGRIPLKGIAEPVTARRVLEVRPRAAGWSRRLDSPLVDRMSELELLHAAFGRTVAQSAAAIVTVTGGAGVGKSRLAAEFLERVKGGATVIQGRCLPYGEGITFWPIVEILRAAAGIGERESPADARRRISELLSLEPDGRLVANRLAALMEPTPATLGIQETFWAVRRLLEHLGSGRPLVVVLDDIQWGEATFFDLLEYLADWIRGAPVLVVCLARPELIEIRPGWMSKKANGVSVSVQPLTAGDTDDLIRNLVGRVPLPQEAQARIAEVAEGYPLFVEETLRMLVDDGALRRAEGTWAVAADLSDITIPPTIHALLSARLDRLHAEERAVIERAAVVGRVFSWGAVAELSAPESRPRVIVQLQSLARKELIRPDYSVTGEDEVFRFTHILVRDAAYRAITKAERADLHERLAGWVIEQAASRAGEYEEIVGYHLEQAHRSLLELGPPGERAESLGRRASEALGAAGRRAFGRGDMPAAVNLLTRAASLRSKLEGERPELFLQLAFALLETGDFETLRTVMADAQGEADASGDAGLQMRVHILGLRARLSTDSGDWTRETEQEAVAAISAFEGARDERGLAQAWALLGLVRMADTRFGPAEEAWDLAATHARLAGDRREELEDLSWVALMVWAGPTHAQQGLPRCEKILTQADGDRKAMSSALFARAAFEAGLGDFGQARESIRRARALLQELGLTVWLAGPFAQFAGWVELLAGDPPAAERELRWAHATLSEIGEVGWIPTVVAILAEAVYLQGRHDEADRLADLSRESASSEDVYSQALWRCGAAKVAATRGDHEAVRVARTATELADRSDFLHLRWHTRMSEAEALDLLGDHRAAEPVLRAAIRLAEQKGNLVGARIARSRLDAVLQSG
jgi:class 3 adenylate cyclase/tetratricopeptide (TPR) repeat protein